MVCCLLFLYFCYNSLLSFLTSFSFTLAPLILYHKSDKRIHPSFPFKPTPITDIANQS